MDQPGDAAVLTEEAVLRGIYSYVQSILSDARQQGILPADDDNEAKLLLTGYKLSFCAAATLDTQTSASFPLVLCESEGYTCLALDNCPETMKPLLQTWLQEAPYIRSLNIQQLSSLRRAVCISGYDSELSTVDFDMDAYMRTLENLSISWDTWCNHRNPPVVPQIATHAPETAFIEVDAPGTLEVSSDADRPQAGGVTQRVPVATRRKRGRPRKVDIPKAPPPASDLLSGEGQSGNPLPSKNVVKWVFIPPSPTIDPPSQPHILDDGCKPIIWASTQEELFEALPELARTTHGIAYEGLETPVLFIDGPASSEDEWDGRKTIRIALSWSFEYRRLYIASDPPPPQAAPPSENVWVFPDGSLIPSTGSPTPPATEESAASDGLSDNRAVDPLSPYYLDTIETPQSESPLDMDPPPEICALVACGTHLPVSIVLCRDAGISPFRLPAGCECAFLGFFFISKISIRESSVLTRPDADGSLVHGYRTWIFDFQWAPGGEEVGSDAILAPRQTPWWMPTSPQATNGELSPVKEELKDDDDTQVGHGFLLLPLHFLAPPSAFGDEVRGWHCTTCGRLNVQRNLCIQKCGTCSTPNGLSPVVVEYVRDIHGVDPTTFPMDRYAPTVVCPPASAASDGLRDFAYSLPDYGRVHHLFTRNHADVQELPSQLFHDIQAEVEIPTQPSTTRGRWSGNSYLAVFSQTQESKSKAPWPTDAPPCVTSVRDMMLRRANLSQSEDKSIAIDILTITAWKAAGNKKGCMLDATCTPIVVLCLGADVQLSFVSNPRASMAAMLPESSEDNEVAETFGTGGVLPLSAESRGRKKRASEEASHKGKASKKQKVMKSNTDTTEILMVTLVHGDMLVVEGGAFEYSMKKKGMSMLIFGSS